MKRIAIIGLVLVFVGAIPISCNWNCLNSCGCDDVQPKEITITSFGLRTSSSTQQEADTTLSYPFNEVWKTLYIAQTEFIALNPLGNHSLNLFINSATACSPAPPKAAEHFEEIKIISATAITLANENDHIAAGQDISDRFEMALEYAAAFQPIASFVKSNTAIYIGDAYRIRLSKKPYKATELKLKFTIRMSNGKTFEFDKQIMKVS